MKRIVITTTFRDFQGNINDKLQLMFLNSLKKQTYQNFVLVVTTFREKNVENTIKKILGEKAVCIHSEIPDNFRYSLSQVILNGMEYGASNDCDVLIYSSADIILQSNFLQIVSERFSPMYAGISHPNIFYDIDESLNVVNKRIGECSWGIDIMFFDINLLNSNQVKKKLQKYVLYEWGGFEQLLAILSIKYAAKTINIFEESKVVKIENDRKAGSESNEYFKACVQRNRKVLNRLAQSIDVDKNNLYDLFYLHMQYDITKNKIIHYLYFRKERRQWIRKRIKNLKERFKEMYV